MLTPLHSGSSLWEAWPELRSTHADLSPFDLRFREHASRDLECLSRATFADLFHRNPLLRYTPQAWPTFIDSSRMRELEHISVAISGLIRTVPERIFRGDAAKIGRFYGLGAEYAELLILPPNGLAGALSRGDFILSSSGFQCVEFNMTSNLGGWETALLAGMVLRIPAIGSFLHTEGIRVRSHNTLRLLFVHAIREALSDLRTEGNEVNAVIGIRESQGPDVVLRFLEHEYGEALRECDPGLEGSVFVCGYDQLAERRSQLYYGTKRIHVLLEKHIDSTERVAFRCFKTGHLKLYNGPISQIMSDKRTLALLSEEAGSGAYSSEEAERVRKYVPWMRWVRPGETSIEGERVSLSDLIVAEQHSMVLKKGRSQGGAHVLIGRFTSRDTWTEALRDALGSGEWVAQRYVESLPFLFQEGEQGCSVHDVVWGPFVFGSTPAGIILRAQPKVLEGVVNLTRGASEGVLLEVDPVGG